MGYQKISLEQSEFKNPWSQFVALTICKKVIIATNHFVRDITLRDTDECKSKNQP